MPEAPKFPMGVERVLRRAAQEPAFRQALLERKSAAAVEAGLALTCSERAVLDAMGTQQLEALLDVLPASEPGQPLPEDRAVADGARPAPVKGLRPNLPVAIGLSVGVLGVAVCAGTVTHGARPDVPPERFERRVPDAGAAQDAGVPEDDRADPEME